MSFNHIPVIFIEVLKKSVNNSIVNDSFITSFFANKFVEGIKVQVGKLFKTSHLVIKVLKVFCAKVIISNDN